MSYNKRYWDSSLNVSLVSDKKYLRVWWAPEASCGEYRTETLGVIPLETS